MDNDNITLSRQGIINRLFCVLMGLLLSSVEVWADTVNYMQYNVGSDSFSSVTANATAISNSITELGTDGNTTYYYVNGDITCTSRITVNGNVHLILVDGKSLTANDGIYVPHGSSLTIYGQSGNTGTLTATGSTEGHSGIGGNENQHESASGDITINGGTINATGYNGGAGIGTGHNGEGSGLTITINGGIITATGGACSGYGAGAGIGSGFQRDNGTIIIRGGKITANGAIASDQWSAGIGAGSKYSHGGNAGIITITGGQITATGGGNHSGIGCGWEGSSGTISLSCSRVDDYIHSTGYTGTTSVADGKELLVFNGTGTTLENVVSGSNPSDIGGKTLRMANYCGASGENAKNVVWYLTNDILHIEKNPTSSTGAMANYTSSTERPWFSYSEEISTLIIGDGVATIGNNAFSYFSNLTSVTIGSGVTSIGNYAFDHSFSSTVPTSITIPTSVSTIGQYAFKNSSLTSVSIPGNTSIGWGAFEYCHFLKTVVIGSGVSSIGNYAFYNCELLESVISYRTTPPTIGTTNVFDGNADGRKIYVPYESVDAYKTAWSTYADQITILEKTWPLTLEAKEAGAKVTFTLMTGVTGVEYSTDGGENWSVYTTNRVVTLTNIGDKVSFRGTNAAYANSGNSRSRILCDKDCYVYGNIMSLIDKTNFATNTSLTETYALASLFINNTFIKNHSSKKLVLPATTLKDYCYASMFYGCTGLTSTPGLPATTLVNSCYNQMFRGCTGLTSAPELSATTLANKCYYRMFYECTGLTSAPELPATTLATYCYDSMFYGCTGLTSAPELPVTTLATYCYERMFYGCTGLTSAPELPATTLATYCYHLMFSGCTGLTSAPALPATTLANNCYDNMFEGCSGLTSAPELPATVLKDECYRYMFYGCTGLTSAPELPATTLANSCYNHMFEGCTGLTSAPALPATTLADDCYASMFEGCSGLTLAPALPATTMKDHCYQFMFKGCTGLTSAPALPATTLASSCYAGMFSGCTNLNKVICLAISYEVELYTYNWLDGVATSGTFIKANDMYWSYDESGIPSGWNVVDGVNNWTDLKSAMSVDNNIVLLGNCTDPAPSSTSNLKVNDGSTVNLDLNGYTIDHGLTSATGDGCVIVVNNGAALTITDSSTGKTGKITGGNNDDTGTESYMGGGIFNKGSLTINGGSIEYNTDAQFGGGIYNDGTLTINGGTITNNHADIGGGGIYHRGNYFYLSGNPTISSNTKNGSAANNVYLDDFPIQITGTLSNTTPIGITMSSPDVFSSGLSGKGKASNFSSDNANNAVVLNASNEARISIILNSTNVSVPNATYNESSQTAVVKFNTLTSLTKGTHYTVTAGTDALTDAGSTTFSITGTGDYTGTVSDLTFTIDKADGALTTAPTAATPTYNGGSQGLLATEGAATGSFYYRVGTSGEFSTTPPSETAANTYNVYYYVEPDGNHNSIAGFGSADSPLGPIACTISPKNLTTPTITLGETSFTYDGTAKKPTVTVKDGETLISAEEYIVSYENNTNVGTATVKIADKDGGNYTVSGSATFAIAAADGSLVPPTGKSDLVYTGSPMDLITAGSSTTGTVQYSLDGSTYNTTIPQGEEAKEYTIYYKVVANPGYTDVAAQSFKVTIAPKTVTAPTIILSESSYTYDGTAKKPDVASVKDGETTIPASEYTVSYEDNINVGTATVKITDKDGGNYTVSGTASFKIEAPEEPAPTTTKQTVEVTTADGEVVKVYIEATVTDETKKEVVITKIDIPASEAGSTEVAIPATIDIGGETYTVTGIADNTFAGKTDITDIYLPNTEKPITIGKDALKISETQIARVHAPLPLLDDYSFDKELEPNLDAGKLMTTVTPQNQYWTFSCGIDVDMPEGVKVYKCMLNDEGTAVIITQISEADLGGIIKAHNGVLLSSTAGHPYDIIASHNADITSIADRDDKSYGRDNLLEPVILRKNYPADEYFVLYNNEFRAILDNSSTVPECRAVLHKPAGVSASRSLDIDEDDTTGIRLYYAFPDEDGDWYNMNGQRIERPTQKGVYIQKGKKIVIK